MITLTSTRNRYLCSCDWQQMHVAYLTVSKPNILVSVEHSSILLLNFYSFVNLLLPRFFPVCFPLCSDDTKYRPTNDHVSLRLTVANLHFAVCVYVCDFLFNIIHFILEVLNTLLFSYLINLLLQKWWPRHFVLLLVEWLNELPRYFCFI